jgi:cytoskeletal protein CcmA (bactofilin family)
MCNTTTNGTAFQAFPGTVLLIEGQHLLTIDIPQDSDLTVPASGEITALGNDVTGTGDIVLSDSPTLGRFEATGPVFLAQTLDVGGRVVGASGTFNTSVRSTSLYAATLEVSGTAQIGGGLSAASGTFNGTLRAADAYFSTLEVAGAVQVGGLSLTNLRVNGSSVQMGPVYMAQTLDVGGQLTADSIVSNTSLNVKGAAHFFQAVSIDGSLTARDISAKSSSPLCNYNQLFDNVDACVVSSNQINANGDIVQSSGSFQQFSAGGNVFASSTFTDAVTFSFGGVEFDTPALFTEDARCAAVYMSTLEVSGTAQVADLSVGTLHVNSTVGQLNVATLYVSGTCDIGGRLVANAIASNTSVRSTSLYAATLEVSGTAQVGGGLSAATLRVNQSSVLNGPTYVGQTLDVAGRLVANAIVSNTSVRAADAYFSTLEVAGTARMGDLSVATLHVNDTATILDLVVNGSAVLNTLEVTHETMLSGPVTMNDSVTMGQFDTAFVIHARNIQMPNVPTVTVTLGTNFVTSTLTQFLVLPFDSINFVSGGDVYDVGDYTFTFPDSGLYELTLSCLVSPNTGGQQLILDFGSTNGDFNGYRVFQNTPPSVQAILSGAPAKFYFTAGQQVWAEIFVFDGTGSTTVHAGFGVGTSFTVVRIGGGNSP